MMLKKKSHDPSPARDGKRAGLRAVLSNRRLRSGGLSMLLTALVILLALLVNYLAATLEDTYALTADFSYNALTDQSDTTRAVLDALQSDVHLYLLDSGAADTLLDVNDLRALLTRYAADSPFVSWSEESLVKNPTFKDRFSALLSEGEITSDCLVVYSEAKKRARVLSADDYITYAYNLSAGSYYISGLSYEKKITESILFVSSDDLPALQILTGHGELSETDTQALEKQLTSSNYTMSRVRVTSDDSLDASAPLLILCPKADLTDEELARLLAFAAKGGSFFFVSEYSDPLDLPNFNALLSAFGFTPLKGLCVAKEEASGSYYDSSPAILLPYMQECSITEEIIAKGHDILLLAGARAFQTRASLNGDLSVQPLLLSGEAYLRDYQDGAATIEQQESDIEGTFTLAAISDWSQADGTHARAFVIGNAGVFTDEWIYSNPFSGEFLLQVLQALQGKSAIDLDILPKSAFRESLSAQSLAVPTALALFLPALIALFALFMLGRRRNL